MIHTGLVSISFRGLSPEEIAQEMVKCGLKYVEWGSDVHAPCTDTGRLEQIAALQKQYGITCCSYGTYFRLGFTPNEELPEYIRAAKLLGTKTLRLWAGKKSPNLFTPEERDTFFDVCRQAAKIAEDTGVVLCMECHRNTYTETMEAALELMQAVNSPAFRMYWQPSQALTVAGNVEYIQTLMPYIDNLHVFQWKNEIHYPLSTGEEEWKTYLRQFTGDRAALLEFMPDNQVESLPVEAQTLHRIVAAC